MAERVGAAFERPDGKVQLSFTAGRDRQRRQIDQGLESIGKLVAYEGSNPERGAIAQYQLDRVLHIKREARRQLAPRGKLIGSGNAPRVLPTKQR